MADTPIPVVDLFAGPGGLGEGFAAVQRGRKFAFEVVLSIEKNLSAYRTLRLRALYWSLRRAGFSLTSYYRYMRAPTQEYRRRLFLEHPDATKAAARSAVHLELGRYPHEGVCKLIESRLGQRPLRKPWVLVGGPPCQAYSLVGRARMRNTKDDFEEDERHFLYEEYLKILAEFLPPVFILENVPGLLSSKVQGADMFGRIRRDLEAPKRAVRRDGNGVTYSLHSLAVGPSAYDAAGRPQYDPRDFIVKSEDYGVPQRRHRVILFGLRSDLRVTPQQLTKMKSQISVADAIGDAPPLRSQVSRRAGKGRRDSDLTLVAERPRDLFGAGGRFVWYEGSPSDYAKRLRDARLGGFVGHEARRHMASDIERYEFAARFAFREGRSPKLADFPKDLLPEHGNVQAGVDGNMFADRFRVQLATEPGTTVTSHISKDGHYYIHYDFEQARSFTVREAARVQSFPDNYFFEGNRTQQYHQVGNAVPPLLAMQIAAVVRTTLARAGMVE